MIYYQRKKAGKSYYRIIPFYMHIKTKYKKQSPLGYRILRNNFAYFYLYFLNFYSLSVFIQGMCYFCNKTKTIKL